MLKAHPAVPSLVRGLALAGAGLLLLAAVRPGAGAEEGKPAPESASALQKKFAAERAAAARPVALLINLGSRRWDTSALIRSLKADPALTRVPLVGYTGHTEVDRIEAGRAAGCDLVVANSAVSGDLATVLRRALEHSA
jgi:CheY-like chemotaxis protein